MSKILDIPDIEYFTAKNTWCGSCNGKRCRIAPGKLFSVLIWQEPFAFDKTPEEQKTLTTFEFSKKGLDEVKAFLNTTMN